MLLFVSAIIDFIYLTPISFFDFDMIYELLLWWLPIA